MLPRKILQQVLSTEKAAVHTKPVRRDKLLQRREAKINLEATAQLAAQLAELPPSLPADEAPLHWPGHYRIPKRFQERPQAARSLPQQPSQSSTPARSQSPPPASPVLGATSIPDNSAIPETGSRPRSPGGTRYNTPSTVGRMSKTSTSIASAWLPATPSKASEALAGPLEHMAKGRANEVDAAVLSAPPSPNGVMRKGAARTPLRSNREEAAVQQLQRPGTAFEKRRPKGRNSAIRRPKSSAAAGLFGLTSSQPPPPQEEPPPPPPPQRTSEMPFPSRVPMAYAGWGARVPTFFEHRGPASFAAIEAIRHSIKNTSHSTKHYQRSSSSELSNSNFSEQASQNNIRKRGALRGSMRSHIDVQKVNAAAWCRHGLDSNLPRSMYGPLV